MLVMKFGGSSVADAESMRRVADLVAPRRDRDPVVVVSAAGRTTDELWRLLDLLESGEADAARELAGRILRRHEEIAGAVSGEEAKSAREAVETQARLLGRLIDGMECLGEVSPRSRDAVLAVGESLSAPLLAAFLRRAGVSAEALDPRKTVVTDDRHGCAAPDAEATALRCRELLGGSLSRGVVPVIGGFVGSAPDGVTTTLGRGGSDLTASLVARALKAEALEYWKDVDGIMSADPALVEEARPVARVSFREAAELAFLGARVLHPASIQPAVEAGVPVRVLNSFAPERPGTSICLAEARGSGRDDPGGAITSIACKRDQLLVNVHATRMLGASGFLRRVFEVFERLELSVDHVATSEVDVTVTLAATRAADRLAAELGEVAAVTVREGMGVVSVVGDRLSETTGVGARIFRALAGTNVRLVTYGGFGVNLSLVVEDERVPEAVRALHRELCRPEPKGEAERG
ncbi:MAG: aspartate kinase [Polyangia bacterium]